MAGLEGLPDQSARIAALTELERSLLVEAGAGSGKTSIMAGRVATLFARGIEPKRVAAITFTEFAASELMIRITHFVVALAKGEIPRDLEIAFPGGVSAEQKANLERAKKSLDQLVCSTIHGFAQALIKPYPVEAGIDPGAEIVDPSEADLAFDEHYEAWLRDHLSGQIDDDIVAELVLANEGGAFGLYEKSRTSAGTIATPVRPPSSGRLPLSRSSPKQSRISGASSSVWRFTKPTPTLQPEIS
jgi:ATP-dependent exoDNAse (exonuclease V) beta subunit